MIVSLPQIVRVDLKCSLETQTLQLTLRSRNNNVLYSVGTNLTSLLRLTSKMKTGWKWKKTLNYKIKHQCSTDSTVSRGSIVGTAPNNRWSLNPVASWPQEKVGLERKKYLSATTKFASSINIIGRPLNNGFRDQGFESSCFFVPGQNSTEKKQQQLIPQAGI
jgi:hypothetical protein